MASTRLPFGAAIMWRTTPPPDGMAQDWNFSVLGSNRTSVLGLTADSLYQMMSFATVMPSRLRLRAARRRPFLDLAGLRIELAEIAAV